MGLFTKDIQSMEDLLRPLGVTLHQYTALSILERREGLSSAQLARRHFVSPQAMNQMIAVMERDGLIERRADPANRKILRAWLTTHGKQVLRHALVGVVDTVTDEGGAADATVPAAAAGEDGPAESDDNAGTSGE